MLRDGMSFQRDGQMLMINLSKETTISSKYSKDPELNVRE
jgi:hypothetical protein